MHRDLAVQHGQALLHLEDRLGIDIEAGAAALLGEHPLARGFAVGYYQAMHLGATLALLCWLYVRRPERYRSARNALVAINLVGFAVFVTWPVAPPRLLPGGLVADHVAALGFGVTHGPLPADQYAALPSLHLAWAVWVAAAGLTAVRSRRWRVLLVAHPVMTAIVVVMTGNHYLLDVAAGVAVGLIAVAVTSALAPRRTSGYAEAETPRTVVFLHAHPDDEALFTGGAMAGLAAAGHRVVLVTATAGEAGLAAPEAGAGAALGRWRSAEWERSATALGCARTVLLGYADSGLHAEVYSAKAFARAGTDEVAARVAEILREEDADVLVGYDRAGGYGHPDHVQVHRVVGRAAELARTPLLLEATVDRTALLRAARLLAVVPGLPAQFRPAALGTAFSSRAELTHRMDVRPFLAAKREAMRAHASQTAGGQGARALRLYLALPGPLFRLAFGTEWYIEPGRATGGPLSPDLLDGLRSEAAHR